MAEKKPGLHTFTCTLFLQSMHKNKTKGRKNNKKRNIIPSSSSSNQSLATSNNLKPTRTRKSTRRSSSTPDQPPTESNTSPLKEPKESNPRESNTPTPSTSTNSLINPSPITSPTHNRGDITIISESEDNSPKRVNVLTQLPITFRLTEVPRNQGAATRSISTPFVLGEKPGTLRDPLVNETETQTQTQTQTTSGDHKSQETYPRSLITSNIHHINPQPTNTHVTEYTNPHTEGNNQVIPSTGSPLSPTTISHNSFNPLILLPKEATQKWL